MVLSYAPVKVSQKLPLIIVIITIRTSSKIRKMLFLRAKDFAPIFENIDETKSFVLSYG